MYRTEVKAQKNFVGILKPLRKEQDPGPEILVSTHNFIIFVYGSPTLGWGGSPLLDAGEVHLANPPLRLNVRAQTNWRRLGTSSKARTNAAWNKGIFYWVILNIQLSTRKKNCKTINACTESRHQFNIFFLNFGALPSTLFIYFSNFLSTVLIQYSSLVMGWYACCCAGISCCCAGKNLLQYFSAPGFSWANQGRSAGRDSNPGLPYSSPTR